MKEVISRRLKNSSPLYDHNIASYLTTNHLYARFRSNLYFSEVNPYNSYKRIEANQRSRLLTNQKWRLTVQCSDQLQLWYYLSHETESSVNEGECCFDPEQNSFPCLSRGRWWSGLWQLKQSAKSFSPKDRSNISTQCQYQVSTYIVYIALVHATTGNMPTTRVCQIFSVGEIQKNDFLASADHFWYQGLKMMEKRHIFTWF